MRRLILASASPRRRELLNLITDSFDVIVSECDENITGLSPEKLVCELAKRKADAVFEANRDAVVIGADTVVAVDDIILGKPSSREEAKSFIKMMRGRAHKVYTGIAVISKDKKVSAYDETSVEFADMSDAEIEAYLDVSDYGDKAGAYGIQGAAAKHIKKINGCYYNVMGLPVALLYEILKNF